MKKVMLLSLLPLFINSGNIETLEVCYEETIIEIKPKNIQPVITDGDLLNALIFVESNGDDSAIGDRHLIGNEAIGVLQIRPIMVREVNRILKIQGKTNLFNLKDRFDRQQSIRMFMVWKNFHHKDSNNEVIARNWNGGPKGYKIKRTEKYWNKIEKQLNNE
jgi:hypothetical protein|tara:strand:+ start:2031 stop:2516 length:486 start_codon:yes stop_codon:yes gene_type:complete